MSTNATWQQAQHILSLVKGKGKTKEQLQELFSSGLLSDLLDADVTRINRKEFCELVSREWRISVNYNAPLEDLANMGAYSLARDLTASHREISWQKFSPSNQGRHEVTLVPFHLCFAVNSVISTENLLTELDGRRLRPASLEEVLVFGAQFPDAQRTSMFVTPIFSCRDRSGPDLIWLNGDGATRLLTLARGNGYFRSDSTFLTVRK